MVIEPVNISQQKIVIQENIFKLLKQWEVQENEWEKGTDRFPSPFVEKRVKIESELCSSR